MKIENKIMILPPLLCCALLLTACGQTGSDSAIIENNSAASVSYFISEAYATLEDPLLRGAGEPSYWPPIYMKTDDDFVVTSSSVNAVTSVTLVPVTYSEQKLYKLNGSDYLISKPDEENETPKIAITNRANELIELKAQNPEVAFYTYFINRATNCDWYGETEGIYAYDYSAYFQKQLGEDSGITCGEFVLHDLQDYMDTGYKLDFHLNHIGAYRAYQEIYAMLANDIDMTPIMEPVNEVDYDNLLMIGQTIVDPSEDEFTEEQMDVFKTYKFDFADFTSYVDDTQMTMGMEEEYSEGQISRDPTFSHLFSFYGGQTGVVRFEFDQSDRPNLLILSDSQGRPIRKLLASHFNRTIYLDVQQTNSLDLDKIIKENDIDLVVLVGQIGIFELYYGN